MTAKKLMAVALACVVAACSDSGTGPSVQDAARFTADQASYAHYQVAVLTLNGAVPAGDISGTLGGETVTLMPLGDSTVVFMVAPVAGAQTLAFAVGNREYEGTITVTAPVSVADPVAYLADFGNEFDVMMDAMDAELAADTLAHPLAHQMLAAARDSLASFRSQMATLSPADAQHVADILNASLDAVSAPADQAALMAGVVHATATGAIPVKCRNLAKPLGRYTCTWLEFVERSARATLAISGALLVAKTTWFAPVITGTVAAALGVFGVYEAVVSVKIGVELVGLHLVYAWDAGAAVYEAGSEFFQANVVDRFITDPGMAGAGIAAASVTPASAFRLASSSMPPTTMSTLTTARPLTFTFAPRFRNVQASDASTPLPWLGLGLNAVAEYNRLVSRINSDWQIRFAPLATVNSEPVDADEIGIEIVGQSAVRVASLVQDGDRTTVTFATDAAGIQEFQYDVVYSSGVYPAVRVRHDAELHPLALTIADRELNEVPDTLTVVAGFEFHLYPLLDADSALIPFEEMLVLQSEPDAGQTGVDVHSAAVTLSESNYAAVHFTAFNYDPNVYSDTVDVDVTVDVGNGNFQPVRTLTFIVDDSTKMYQRSAAGTWVQTDYAGPGQTSTTTFVLNEDGTGEILSYTFMGEPQPVPDREFSWNTTMNFSVADDVPYPMWRMGWSGGVLGGGGPVTYPVQSYSGSSSEGYTFTGTKQ